MWHPMNLIELVPFMTKELATTFALYLDPSKQFRYKSCFHYSQLTNKMMVLNGKSQKLKVIKIYIYLFYVNYNVFTSERFSWCVHFKHNTTLFIKSKHVCIIQSRTFWYFVRQLSERGRIMFFHFIIYLYQYLYKVLHVMVGSTVYWYTGTLYSGNDCQYTCRSLSFIFYVKKSIYLYICTFSIVNLFSGK